jgi:hypothetical protein
MNIAAFFSCCETKSEPGVRYDSLPHRHLRGHALRAHNRLKVHKILSGNHTPSRKRCQQYCSTTGDRHRSATCAGRARLVFAVGESRRRWQIKFQLIGGRQLGANLRVNSRASANSRSGRWQGKPHQAPVARLAAGASSKAPRTPRSTSKPELDSPGAGRPLAVHRARVKTTCRMGNPGPD